ncbi:hypothetical protein Hanom_Chr14g01308601 [Helianthus anomalus]
MGWVGPKHILTNFFFSFGKYHYKNIFVPKYRYTYTLNNIWPVSFFNYVS